MAKKSVKPVEATEVKETPIDEVTEIKTGIVIDCVTLNLRKEPSTSAEVITTIPVESELQIIEASKEWITVKFKNKKGFVMSDYVSIN